jgi:hypothetical protein
MIRVALVAPGDRDRISLCDAVSKEESQFSEGGVPVSRAAFSTWMGSCSCIFMYLVGLLQTVNPHRADHRLPIDEHPGRMEDKRVILWLAVLLHPCDFGKRDQGIVADAKGKNDTFIAL